VEVTCAGAPLGTAGGDQTVAGSRKRSAERFGGGRSYGGRVPDALKTRVALDAVPETLLWTLYQRATEARRPRPVIHDPKAIELVDAIDYPFDRFGQGNWGQAEGQALRAATFDAVVRRFLTHHPDGTVVALGEGLETQFWRVDNGRVRWVTVELPEVIELRRRLLPSDARQRLVAGTVTDLRWMDGVDDANGVLLTAEGLLMYLHRAEVHRLITACARRFPGASLVFDTIPTWFSAQTTQGRVRTLHGYQAPPMRWGVNGTELDALRRLPGLVSVTVLPMRRGRGLAFGYVVPTLDAVPALRRRRPFVMPLPSALLATFAGLRRPE
jgi:O-methyltransferase involved in polyketide biosynthesis